MDETDRVSLSDDWIEGEITNPRLVEPVMVARSVLKEYRHPDALALWIRFYEVACSWKEAHGVEPEFRLGIPRTFEQGWPWECAGRRVLDPVDLLTTRLPGFEPYDSLEQQHGRTAILAAICLEYADRHDVEVAEKAARWLVRLDNVDRLERTVWTIALGTLDALRPLLKRRRGRPKQTTGRLREEIEKHLKCHENADINEIVSALPKAKGFQAPDGFKGHSKKGSPVVVVYDGKPVTKKTVENTASAVREQIRIESQRRYLSRL